MSKNVWWVSDDHKLGLGSYDSGTDTMSSYGTSGDTVRVYFIKRVAHLSTTLTAEFAIPTQFHHAIVARVLQQLYAQKENLQAAGYWRGEWLNGIRKGKRYSNVRKTRTPIRIRQHGH